MKGWVIFVLSVAIYGVSVFGGFVQDDFKVIGGDPEMGKVSAVFAAFARPYYYMDGGNAGAYRPLTSFSLYLNALVTGKEPWGFHLVNVLLYAGVCLLVFEVMKKFTSLKAAFWATLVFTVLPVHTEAVINIVGRGEVLSLGLVLLAVLFQSGKKWEMSAVALLLALLSKETAIVGLPVLLYLTIFNKENKDTKIGVFSFYVLVTISYLLLRGVVLGNGGMGNNATVVENPLKFATASVRVMNAVALVPFGIGKVIFPWHLSYDYSFNQLKLINSWFDWRVLLGVGLMLLSAGSVFTKLGRSKLWILGLAFFWGPLAVTGNFLFPVGTIFGERLWFWPSLGIVMIFMSLFNPAVLIHLENRTLFRLRESRPDLQPKTFRVRKDQAFWLCATFPKLDKYSGLLLILLFLCAGRTMVRNFDWLSQDSLFIHDAVYAKDSVMAQSNAAAMYLIRKDFVRGKEYLDRAEAIYPKYPELINNRGMYYLWTGDKAKAKEIFEECLREIPGFYLCEGNLELIK